MAQMLPDGSNPEGVDPEPPLDWKSKDDFKDVVLYGALGSPPTIKVLCYLILNDIPYKHVESGKKGTDYKKMPVIDVSGRQVNDSGIILKYLVPALGLAFNQEWEDKITKILDTTMRGKISKPDAAKFANAYFGLPACVASCLSGTIQGKLNAASKKSIAMNKGFAIGDEVQIAKEFRAAIGQNTFFGGNEPGPVDISMFGFMAPGTNAGLDWFDNMIKQGELTGWLVAMHDKVSFAKLFGKKAKPFKYKKSE